MAAPKSERMLNLLIMLLVSRSWVSKARIREIHYPASSDEAFDKMFERDKDELRSLGVPIEVGATDPLFGDEQGYRIRPDEFALPEISLTPDEGAVIGLATQVWGHARLATATSEAVRKLTAAGIDVDLAGLDLVQPRLTADEPSFEAFFDAVHDRVRVSFDYRRGGEYLATTRHLEPWGVFRYRQRWYVLGFDTDRSDERIFRLSRVVGRVRRHGPVGAYEVPEGTDLADAAARLTPSYDEVTGVVLARPQTASLLRHSAVEVEEQVAGPDGTTGWDRLHLRRATTDLAGDIVAFGPSVWVESPQSLRTEVVTRLQEALGKVSS